MGPVLEAIKKLESEKLEELLSEIDEYVYSMPPSYSIPPISVDYKAKGRPRLKKSDIIQPVFID